MQESINITAGESSDQYIQTLSVLSLIMKHFIQTTLLQTTGKLDAAWYRMTANFSTKWQVTEGSRSPQNQHLFIYTFQ